MSTKSTQPKSLQCRHILPSGHRCGSPSLRQQSFCYYHHTTRKSTPPTTPKKHTAFDLPRPKDRTSVQHSIGEVLRLLAADEIDPRRAGLLLYGLQIASHNLPKAAPTTQPVEDLTPTPDGEDLLAPEAEFQTGPHEKTLEEILNEQWERSKQFESDQIDLHAAAHPTVTDSSVRAADPSHTSLGSGRRFRAQGPSCTSLGSGRRSRAEGPSYTSLGAQAPGSSTPRPQSAEGAAYNNRLQPHP